MTNSIAPYLRYPHLHGDLVTFVADDDVWIGPVAGGRAWRITADHVPALSPRFSPDGSHLAYVSHRDAHPEVMVVEVDTGATRRLTWRAASVSKVLGWLDNGRVLIADNAGEGTIRHVMAKAVGLDGSIEHLPWGPVGGAAVRSDGAIAVSTFNRADLAQWKRYRGGTAPRLWLDPTGSGDWRQLLSGEPAGIVDPMWFGDTLMFVSDRAARFPDRADEQANLWAWESVGGDGEAAGPQQLTSQGEADGYVRDATSDGSRIVWHSRGDLWLLDQLDGEPRRLDLQVAAPPPGPKSVPAAPHVNRIVPDRGGDGSLVGVQGATFWLTHRGGPARAIVADAALRSRESVLLGSDRAAVVTDAGSALPAGDDSIEIHRLDGTEAVRHITVAGLGRVLHTAASPNGSSVATVSHDGAIRLIDVTSGDNRAIGRSPYGEAAGLRFSPDSRYLIWSQPIEFEEGEVSQLMLADLTAEGEPVAVTSGRYHDFSPDFTSDGKSIAFLSNRTFDPSYDSHEFALRFSAATRPWLIPLSAAEPGPFGPSVDGWPISSGNDNNPDSNNDSDKDTDKPGANTESNKAGVDKDGEIACPDFDAEGAEERVIPFPVPSGDYRDLRAAKGGLLWVKVNRDTGELGTRRAGVDGDPSDDELEFFSFSKRSVATVADGVDFYGVSGDGERLVVRHKDSVHVQPADRRPSEGDSGERVSVDLSRVRLEVEPTVRWGQMFDENARIMTDHFWRADMDGVDWRGVIERWRPLVARLRTDDDLEDLLWETIGELNTSHAYVMPPNPPGDQKRRLGLLGADLSPTDDGAWRIDRVLPGESTEPAARSPLQAAGVDGRQGDLIVAVDGQPVDPVVGPARQLVGAAGKAVELTLRRDGADRRVVVVPLGDEQALRYQDWVRSRREYVAEHSQGRLGYVHIPDMMSSGWAQLHRDLRMASQAEGIIADVRYNRGGHTSQMVLARLGAKVIGWGTARHLSQPSTYPSQAPRGPVVFVANQYSGSDGDIVNAAAQAMGLGPVVGVRTWGGVVGIDGRFDLVDGTVITQPRYAFWLEGKGFGVENHGVDPDVEVVHTPADYHRDADPQLDRAIAEAFRQLDEFPAAAPPSMPEPKVR